MEIFKDLDNKVKEHEEKVNVLSFMNKISEENNNTY